MYFFLTHKTECDSIIIEIESRPNGLTLESLELLPSDFVDPDGSLFYIKIKLAITCPVARSE